MLFMMETMFVSLLHNLHDPLSINAFIPMVSCCIRQWSDKVNSLKHLSGLDKSEV